MSPPRTERLKILEKADSRRDRRTVKGERLRLKIFIKNMLISYRLKNQIDVRQEEKKFKKIKKMLLILPWSADSVHKHRRKGKYG